MKLGRVVLQQHIHLLWPPMTCCISFSGKFKVINWKVILQSFHPYLFIYMPVEIWNDYSNNNKDRLHKWTFEMHSKWWILLMSHVLFKLLYNNGNDNITARIICLYLWYIDQGRALPYTILGSDMSSFYISIY